MELSKAIDVKNKLDNHRLIKVVEFDPSKNNTKPHRHNGYLELVYLSQTSGKHVIDGREYSIKTPCLLIIRKDNVHNWELVNPIDGYVILVKDKFVLDSLDLEISRLINQICQYDILYLSAQYNFKSILRLLGQEDNRIVQEGLFKAFLAKILENKNLSIDNTNSLTNSLYDQLCGILNQEMRVVNHVAYSASILHTTPQNLNTVCKKYANLTASDLIAVYIIKEAKRLLIYTSNSVSEIAFELGFSDKSNFSKYFKRYVGLTPTEFKK